MFSPHCTDWVISIVPASSSLISLLNQSAGESIYWAFFSKYVFLSSEIAVYLFILSCFLQTISNFSFTKYVLLAVDIQLSKHHLHRLSFFNWMDLAPLSKIHWPYICDKFFFLSFQFYCIDLYVSPYINITLFCHCLYPDN